MKKKKQLSDVAKTVILLLCCAAAFIIFTAILAKEEDSYQGVPNSSYSSEDNGTLALYYGAQEMGKAYGFEVSRNEKPSRFLEEKSIVVSFNQVNASEIFEYENVVENIKSGSIYLCVGSILSVAFDENFVETEPTFYKENDSNFRSDWTFLKHTETADNSGGLYIECTPYDSWKNGEIKKDSDFAEEFLVMLSFLTKEYGVEHVVFNEYYNGIAEDSSVDILTLGFVLFLVQAGVAVVLLMLAIAKRFGAPRVEYSTVKRDENENVYAVAYLYQRTQSFDVVFDINMEMLLADLGKTLGAMNSELHNYEYIIELAKESGIEKSLAGYAELANAYKKPKKKIKSKKDLNRKLKIIENLRRKLSDG